MTYGWSDPRRGQDPQQQPGQGQQGRPVQPGQPGYGQPGPAQPGQAPQAHPGQFQQPGQRPHAPQRPRPHGQPQQPQFRPQPQGQLQPYGQQQFQPHPQGPWQGGPAGPGQGASAMAIQRSPGTAVDGSWTTQFSLGANQVNPLHTRNIILLVAGILLTMGLGGLFLLIILFQSIAFSGVGFIILLLSSIPLLAIFATILLLDRWKPQPIVLLLSCVLWGAVASIILTLVGQLIFGFAAYQLTGIDTSAPFISSVIMAPLFEETTKTVFLVVVVLAARRFFEGPLDGFMYGSLIGAGFAFTENLLYLNGAYENAQATGLITLFFMRCVMSPLLHSSFSALAGLSIGFAARRGQWWMVALMWIPGLIAGMILHGLWNGMASLPLSPMGSLLLMLGLSITIALCWWGTGFFLWYRETKTARDALMRYASAGWLSEAEAQMLGTWKGRRAGRRWATGPARRHMKAMIRVAATLPTTRDRVEAGVGGEKEKEYEVFLLNRLTAERKMMMRAMGLAA